MKNKKRNSRKNKSSQGKDSEKKYQRNPNEIDQNYSNADKIRLNKFIAHSGFCSRREADRLIEEGKVYVNGKRVTELGVFVKKTEKVVVDGQQISLEPFVYILLHKPKDTISTTSDEKDRNTVLDKIEDATGYRVYPVGRLDRNTTGLLILTNDGDLAHRLMHPSYKVRKTYKVQSKRILSDEELTTFRSGVELEDGVAKAYNIKRAFEDPSVFTLSVFEGRNRLIRRMVEFFGTEVEKLKRIEYASLNLKGVSMGRWRFLRQKEINNLRKLVKLDALDFNKEK